MKLFSHRMAQQQWASVDYRKNISIIGLVHGVGRKEIVAIGSYADEDNGRAEVAFVVKEDYQGLGIASQMLAQLEKIARVNGFKGFTATILKENVAMEHVFKKRYPNAEIIHSGGNELLIVMDFSEETEEPEGQ
jgi:GNAT superfamily N-acetyltransferase